jgi:tetratricopeptide (TPR) repeat protein
MGDSVVLRPAPSASGTLAKTPLVHLLVYIHDRKLTGTVELWSSDKRTTASIRFIVGEPAKVRTNVPGMHLGDVLLDLGYLTERQLTDSISQLQSGKAAGGGKLLHGQLLLGKALLDRKKLETALAAQVARKLRAVAPLPPDAMYGFYDGFDGLRGWGGDEEQGYDPIPMLWGVLSAGPPLEHIEAGLAKVGGAPLKLVKDADDARLALDETGRKVVEALRARPSSVQELAARTGLPYSQATLVAYLLLITKQVEVLRAQDGPRGMSIPAPGSPTRGATSSNPPAAGRGSKPPSPSTPAASPSGKMRSVQPPPPATLLPELATRWQEITERASTIDRADYFMMLDLARDATREDVENAFFALAKTWHPDRLPPELAPVRDACSRVFSRMSEAQSTLTDEAKRKQYMGLLADGSGSPETQETVAKVIEAATDFQKAEVCFKRNDLVQAEQWCRKAADADPTQPSYRSLLAWLTALKPENQSPEKTLEAIKMLDSTIQANSKAEAAYVWRGLLYKRIGKDDVAMRDFQRAVQINPRNIDAAREVRLFQMRASRTSGGEPKEDEAGRPSLLGRLFKK